LHWPDRRSNYFGRLGFELDPEDDPIPLEATLEVLADLIKSGKVRHVGISNETPWGAMRYLALSEARGLPRMVSIQNPYSLLNRSFEIGLAEVAIRESMGLLAYSPLAFGVLSGKYLHGARPADCRITLFERFTRYTRNPLADEAAGAYVELAKRHSLDPAQMALAYVNSRSFVTATIIGATNLVQLKSDIASIELKLSADVLSGIENIHHRIPNPCP